MSESRQNHRENEQSPTLGDAIAYGLGVSKVTPDGERIGISTSDFYRIGIDVANTEGQPSNEEYHLKGQSAFKLSAIPVAPAAQDASPMATVSLTSVDEQGQTIGILTHGLTLAHALREMADCLDKPADTTTPVVEAADNG